MSDKKKNVFGRIVDAGQMLMQKVTLLANPRTLTKAILGGSRTTYQRAYGWWVAEPKLRQKIDEIAHNVYRITKPDDDWNERAKNEERVQVPDDYHGEDVQKAQKMVKKHLYQLARHDMGRQLIMNYPAEVPIMVVDSELCKDWYGRASYHNQPITCLWTKYPGQGLEADKAILLNEGDNDAFNLAHEMGHAVQDKEHRKANRCFDFSSVDKSINQLMCFTHSKLIELEQQIRDCVFESLFLTDVEKSLATRFYEDEIQRYKKAGCNKKKAEQKARNSLARAYWSGGIACEQGHSPIIPDLTDELQFWSDFYDYWNFWKYYCKSDRKSVV